jgi:membrane protease YdiL (CAAX protease family)
VSALWFALLHPILLPGVHRLLVFFPALLFGYLRARTGNIGAAVVIHATSNLLLAILVGMYTWP